MTTSTSRQTGYVASLVFGEAVSRQTAYVVTYVPYELVSRQTAYVVTLVIPTTWKPRTVVC